MLFNSKIYPIIPKYPHFKQDLLRSFLFLVDVKAHDEEELLEDCNGSEDDDDEEEEEEEAAVDEETMLMASMGLPVEFASSSQQKNAVCTFAFSIFHISCCLGYI